MLPIQQLKAFNTVATVVEIPPIVTGAQSYGRHASQAVALTEARLFAQQLHLQQLQQGQSQDSLRRTSMVGAGSRSAATASIGGRGSTAASTAASIVGIGGTSPVLSSGGVVEDEPIEHTLLLVRPTWVLDQDAAACQICTRTFNAVRRKHHCRQCGRVLCNDCSSRSIALPQLGYTKAVRVCNDCFDVAYLVAYCISDELGQSTQIHGARGLYDLINSNNEKAIEGVLTHGGLDAVLYLCNITRGYELHALATSSLATLSEIREVQGVIVAKRTMPKLFHLVSVYTQNSIAPTRPLSPSTNMNQLIAKDSLDSKDLRCIETTATVLMNITHIIFQMVPDKLLAKQLAQEGAVDSLISLSVYFPAGVRTRAMEHALQAMSLKQGDPENQRNDTVRVTSQPDQQRHSVDGQSQHSFDDHGQNGVDEETLLSIDDQFHDRLEVMQGMAARCISVLTTDVTNQSFIVDDPERIDRLVQLLYSTNTTVVKYASKTMAFLSLRNDRNKPDIVKGSGAAALLAVIQGATNDQGFSDMASIADSVSYACCALANLATNTESQEILMSHADLLSVTCAAVGLFPHQREVERHVARLVANLALYEQNKIALLTAYGPTLDNGLADTTSQQPQRPSSVYRYSSPPPAARRARGNVIPTLLQIGELTLERTNRTWDPESDNSFSRSTQDPSDGEPRVHLSPDAGYQHIMNSDAGENGSQAGSTADNDAEFSGWTTIQGMEDVQRHIVRAIDNLLTAVTENENPSSDQSFKVFSRIWPTIGLVKTIQMTNQDEDTQRRALHVLSTLIQLSEIHADAMVAMKGQTLSSAQDNQGSQPPSDPSQEMTSVVEQEQTNYNDQVHAAPVQASGRDDEKEKEKEKDEDERSRQEKIKQGKKQEKAKKNKLQKECLEKQRLEEERLEKERLEVERLEKQRLEEERAEQKRLEEHRLEQERLEKQRLEEERLEQERLEEQRLEKERLEKQRLEEERLEKERLKEERREKKRLEKERLERERLEKERLEKERLEEERLEKERLEAERLEAERLEAERLEAERLEAERLEAERLEQERLEAERLEQERLEAERLEKERLEAERLEQEHLEAERLEQERLEKERLELENAKKRPEKREEAVMANADSAPTSPSKGVSSSEEQTTSQDESPVVVKDKSKKKKKKKSK
ncbi:hypothetical protein BGX31_002955 [Mortierella sp. GBA43]|nr:hypothetical protein BGX31_002955 [Mortierella sp. GBA43]